MAIRTASWQLEPSCSLSCRIDCRVRCSSGHRKRRHNLTPAEFVELDKKYNILHFLEIGYEPFHLTGTQGVVEEVEEYIKIKQSGQ
jgi:hypothetical protein